MPNYRRAYRPGGTFFFTLVTYRRAIPPGTHWSDAKPILLPNVDCRLPNEEKAIEKTPRVSNRKSAIGNRQSQEPQVPVKRNGLMFDIPKQGEPLPEDKPTKAANPKAAKVRRVCDPQLATAARELRDRWLEQVNSGQYEPTIGGKYDVMRAIERRGEIVEPMKVIAA